MIQVLLVLEYERRLAEGLTKSSRIFLIRVPVPT
jgi:hypothetical protein